MLLIGFLVLGSCTEVENPKFFKHKNNPPSLIRNHLLFSSRATEYSFPIWFNDSLIRENKIARIKRIIYQKNLMKITLGESLPNTPSETIEYLFSKTGFLKTVNHTFYFDNHKISEFEFSYTKSPNKIGFSNVKLLDKMQSIDTLFHLNQFGGEQFSRYEPIKFFDHFATFKNIVVDELLHVVFSQNYWRPLTIDRKMNPNPNDLILLGNLFHPEKIYQVENKVTETYVELFNYRKGNIQNIKSWEYPFRSSRSFVYDKRGYCIGFIDSTYSENSFLTRTISDFENNMFFSPTKIYHRKENSVGKLTLINSEEFVYEFRK